MFLPTNACAAPRQIGAGYVDRTHVLREYSDSTVDRHLFCQHCGTVASAADWYAAIALKETVSEAQRPRLNADRAE
jgi:hypothetical protein